MTACAAVAKVDPFLQPITAALAAAWPQELRQRPAKSSAGDR